MDLLLQGFLGQAFVETGKMSGHGTPSPHSLGRVLWRRQLSPNRGISYSLATHQQIVLDIALGGAFVSAKNLPVLGPQQPAPGTAKQKVKKRQGGRVAPWGRSVVSLVLSPGH